jgi:multidrug efflux pump subunit AcrA (membrane-fusion protein)
MQVMSFGLCRWRAAAFAATTAGVFAACGHGAPAARPVSGASVPVVNARAGSVTPRATLGGLIVPFQNVQLQSNLSEPTLVVNVKEGDHVTKGEVLAVLDTTDLRAQLQSYLGTAAGDHARVQSTYLQAGLTITQNSNSIDSAEATLKQAQQTLSNDQLNLQRDVALTKNGYLAQQTLDAQRITVANDQQAVRSAQVTVDNSKAQVVTNGTTASGLQGATVAAARADEQSAIGLANQTRSSIAKATIVSPIDGVVVNRNLNPGEYPGTRQIFTLQEVDKVYAVLNGGGAQVLGVQPGSVATIQSSDRSTIHGIAHVVAVLDQITPGSTNFVIKAVLPNPKGDFHSGMVISGVVSQPPTSGVTIPVTAFVDDSQSTVQTLSNGVVKTLPVTMIAEDGKHAVVRGLNPGQQIISNGQLGLSDGQSAQPLKPKTNRTVAER